MVRLLGDENFNDDIVRGLLLRQPDLDLVRVRDVGLGGADDPDVLAWEAQNDRIVLTHDRATMPDYAYARMARGESMTGVLILNDRFPVGHAIQEILEINACSAQEEWNGRVVHLPLTRPPT
jgi:predicted nuclease of predicted toxin-antitoxin system